MEVSLRTMLWLLLALYAVSADVYDKCLIDGREEVFIKNVLESETVGSVIKKLKFNGSVEELEVTADKNEFFFYNNTTREIVLIAKLDIDAGRERMNFGMKCALTATPMPQVDIKVIIIIQDANDNPPVFQHTEYHINISETQEINTNIITTVRATDKDADKSSNGLVYYSLLPSMYSSYFDIRNPLSTDLTLLKSLDFETLPLLSVQIMAMDQPSAGLLPLNATTTLYLRVLDVDDLPPVFNEPSYNGSVPERSVKGTIVNLTKPISASDQDTSINASIKYSIKKDTTDYFMIDPDTAVVTVNIPSPAQEISIMIEARQADNKFRTDTTFLKIIVSASNTNPPEFQQKSYSAEVPESLRLGSAILTVMATDRDFGTKLSYYLFSDEEVFSIDPVSGVIRLQKELDYETVSVYIIQVAATDGQFNATTTVTVSISDINDNNPVITPIKQAISIARENGSFVAKIQADDSDANTVLRYSLASHSRLFSITSGGVLRISANPDDLTENQYEVVVIVTDNGVPSRQSSSVVTVKFPSKDPVIGGVVQPKSGSDVISISLGVLAAVLLIVVIILTVYIIRRRLQSTEQLDKAKHRNTMDPRGLLFKTNPGSRAPSRTGIHFPYVPEETSDGGTTVAENPFSLDGNRNYGYNQNDESENDRDMDEIHIETSVIPFRNGGHKFPSNEDLFPNVDEDEDGLPMAKMDHTYHNGSLSTFKDSNSNDSLHSDSTNSKRGLMKGMNGIATKSLPSKKLSWAGTSDMPSNKSLNSFDGDPSVSPIDEKPEITVYF